MTAPADILIRGGLVVDGTGGPSTAADVLVSDGRIAAIGAPVAGAAEEIDASGCLVTPGFIDIHSHADYTLLVDPRAASALSQGVTLEVIGNCGHGCFPLRDADLAATAIYGISDRVALDWRTGDDYLARLEAARPGVNVLTLVPNGQLRQAVTGLKPGPADPEERERMVRLLEDGLDAGAFGYSTGLEYPLERGADRNEILALLRPVARRGRLYATHTRDRDDAAVEAVVEAIDTAREAEVRLQISHLMPRGPAEDADRCIELVDAARAGGQDLAFDMHTRRFAMTFLHAMLPAWAFEAGLKRIGEVVADRKRRERILAHRSMLSAQGWDRVVLLDNELVPDLARRTIAQIGEELGLPPAEAALELLARGAGHAEPLMIIAPLYQEADQTKAFAHPLCMPGSDATTLARDGPLANSTFHGAYDWAAWFYHFAVHEGRFLTAEEAVHRLTGQPAEVLGLADRGRLAVGAKADVAIFEDRGLRAETTLWSPNRVSSGMRCVLVNGAVAFRAGQCSDQRSGEVIRKAH